MKKGLRITLITLIILGIITLSLFYLSTHNIAVLNPKGMIALRQKQLIIFATLLMLIVVIPVFIITLFFIWRYKASNIKAKYTPDSAHNYIAECFWWGIPFIIIIILGIVTYTSSHELNPFKPIDTGKKSMVIQVVALEWKWLFIYPEENIATINFIQFPEHTPLDFEITADAPMNSFWIPQLGGQIYAMPAMRSKLHLIAHESGDYRGSSAQLSGLGFAGMSFIAKASSQADFDRWVQSVKQSGKSLTLEEYDRLVAPSEHVKPAFYVLKEKDLFDQIIIKYITPYKE